MCIGVCRCVCIGCVGVCVHGGVCRCVYRLVDRCVCVHGGVCRCVYRLVYVCVSMEVCV